MILVDAHSLLGNDPGPVELGDVFSDAQGKSVVVGFEGDEPPPTLADCAAVPPVDTDATPDVAIEQNCDGGDVPTPLPVEGLTYEFVEGDGVSGPWHIHVTADDGFVVNGLTDFFGNAGDPSSCPTGPQGEPVEDEPDALPDTGGPQLGLIPLGGLLIVAGAMVVGRRRTA